MKNYKQLNLKSYEKQQDYPKERNSSNKISILFRNTVPEIPSTTFGTFAIYKYPAKFIPQVIAYVLKRYAKKGEKIFDPFAGYGTVGVVARVYGFEYELWDLNPIMETIHATAIMEKPKIDLMKLLDELKRSSMDFIPDWSNLDYWFPEEFIPILSKTWGYVHSAVDDIIRRIVTIPLLKVTRYFSYSDEKVHKLYKSKYSLQKIECLLKKDWRRIFYNMLKKEIQQLLKKIWEYHKLKPKKVNYVVKAGVDTLETVLEEDADLLITSPPYLQAQEYIRSTKLELFWLGYKESYIKELSKKEIPYRKVSKIEIQSEKYHEYREKIKEDHLKKLYDRYFYAILNAFATLGNNVKDYMCIFVGPAKIRNISIPIDDIIVEHLEHLDWKHEITFIDKIVSRVMFESQINPASGIKDSRIKTEHLVVLKRR